MHGHGVSFSVSSWSWVAMEDTGAAVLIPRALTCFFYADVLRVR
jgi:hypothetical protein